MGLKSAVLDMCDEVQAENSFVVYLSKKDCPYCTDTQEHYAPQWCHYNRQLNKSAHLWT